MIYDELCPSRSNASIYSKVRLWDSVNVHIYIIESCIVGRRKLGQERFLHPPDTCFVPLFLKNLQPYYPTSGPITDSKGCTIKFFVIRPRSSSKSASSRINRVVTNQVQAATVPIQHVTCTTNVSIGHG